MFEHTADLGLRVTAESVEQLFVEAASAIAALLIDNPEAIEPRLTVTIELEAEDLEGLFVDWLKELIYRFETEHVLFRECSISVTDDHRAAFALRTPAPKRLQATCRGEPVDWTRHQPGYEVKAVTYHQLRVARTATGWEAIVIVDI